MKIIKYQNFSFVYEIKYYLYFSDELLIELVKNKPGLYDLQSPHYSDNNYKKRIWDEVEKAVQLNGKFNSKL